MTDPVEQARAALSEPRPFGIEEVAQRAGVPVETLKAVLNPFGAIEEGYGDRDVEYAKKVAILLEHLPSQVVTRSARIRARAIGQIVVNDLSIMGEALIDPLRGADDAADRIGKVLRSAAEELTPVLSDLIAADYVRILEHLLGQDVVSRAVSGEQADTVQAAIGFVDLVGYTRFTTETQLREVGTTLAAFEDLVDAVAAEADATWPVKLLGDAAMLFGERPAELARVLLEILDPDNGLPDMARRAGMAAGEILVRDGDYFGDTVNLASRLTGLARPWALLVAEDVRDELGDEFDAHRIPPARLRGIGTRRPLRVRPAQVT